MTKQVNKCPNCGHQFKEGEEFCPNCDLFIPVSEQTETTFDPNQTKQFKTFKEIEKKEDSTNYAESRFKHRTKKQADEEKETEKPETRKEQLSVPNTSTTSNNQELNIKPETVRLPIEDVIEKTVIADDITPEIDTTKLVDGKIYDEESNQTGEIINEKPQPLTDPISDKVEPTRKTNKNNKKKMFIGLACATVLVIGGGTFYSNQQKKAAKEAETELVSKTQKELSSLFSSEDHVFLKDGLTKEELELAKKDVSQLKTSSDYESLEKLLNEAEIKFNQQESINQLFKSPIIKGNSLADNAFIKDETPLGLTRIPEEKDGFDILFNKAFDEAKSQKETLQAITEKIALVFKDDSVVKDVSRDDYKAAKKLVDELKDPEMKETFNKQLKEVDTFLVKAEDKKKEDETRALEAEQERLAQLQQENTQQPVTNNQSGLTGPGSDYRWGNREDATKDFNDAAWAWAPGVQEKVLSEAISRGYVVEGGYTLVPKYVENGEGYYDLYATTNSKIFPKSKPEEFPLYVVTINAKTGWFKGNGPN